MIRRRLEHGIVTLPLPGELLNMRHDLRRADRDRLVRLVGSAAGALLQGGAGSRPWPRGLVSLHVDPGRDDLGVVVQVAQVLEHSNLVCTVHVQRFLLLEWDQRVDQLDLHLAEMLHLLGQTVDFGSVLGQRDLLRDDLLKQCLVHFIVQYCVQNIGFEESTEVIVHLLKSLVLFEDESIAHHVDLRAHVILEVVLHIPQLRHQLIELAKHVQLLVLQDLPLLLGDIVLTDLVPQHRQLALVRLEGQRLVQVDSADLDVLNLVHDVLRLLVELPELRLVLRVESP